MLKAWKYLASGLLLVLAAAWIAGTSWSITHATEHSWALWLEHWTGDVRSALFSHRPKRQHEHIALVTIDDDTMQPYPYRSPVDRRLLASLVTSLDQAGARAIGLDFLILKPTERQKDEELIAAIRQAKSRVIIAGGDNRAGLSPDQLKYQRAFLRSSGATGGYVNLITGSDYVVRYIAEPGKNSEFRKSFASILVKSNTAPLEKPQRIAWMLSPHDGNERFFSIPAHLLVAPSGKTTPVAPTLLTRFKDKLVIIGGDFPDIDQHQVPMLTWRGEDDEIAGMLIHAQVAAQMVDGRRIEHLDRELLLALFAVLAGLGLWFGMRHGLVALTLYASAASVLVVAADMALFYFMDRIIPFGACLAALAAGAAGGIVLHTLRLVIFRTR